jgi:hypothetical protein
LAAHWKFGDRFAEEMGRGMRGVILAAALLVGGCSGGMGITPAGPDTYNLTRHVAPVVGGDADAEKLALTEVNTFCEQKGLTFVPVSMGLVPSGLNPPSLYSVTFQCVSTNGSPTNGPPTADPHRYVELVRGNSTRDEAVAKLGPPQGTTDIRGDVLLQWVDNNAAQPFRVAILFGPDGRMIRVTEVYDPISRERATSPAR